MIKGKILPWIIFLVLLAICSSAWFFAIPVDYPLLIILGYFVAYFVFRYLVKEKSLKWARKIFFLLMAVIVLALWVGGILPYLDITDPAKDVYFNILSQEQLGYQTGNDFMWNGLLYNLLGGRIVPLELIPTYDKPLFNLFAALFWVGIPFVLYWSYSRGRRHASGDLTRRKLWWEWVKTFIYTGLSLALMISIIRIIVVIYS